MLLPKKDGFYMNPLFEECAEWLRKGNNDLLSARILLYHDKPVTDTACFHCQQAVEKILKAYLILNSIRFEKNHNLAYLLDICEKISDKFSEIREKTEALTPFAVEIRYPGDILDVSLEEARELLVYAEDIVKFVAQYLPEDLKGFLS